MLKLMVSGLFLALNLYTYNFLARDAVIPDRTLFKEFPDQLGDWSCLEREYMDDSIVRNLGVTDYLICNYARPSPPGFANVYVGYHASQVREEGGGARENSIHPPVHCLPGSGWDIIQNETVHLEMPGLPNGRGTAKRLIIARGKLRQLVYYWYQSRGRMISQDWEKVVYVGWDRAVRKRTDGSLVRITVPIVRDDVDTADSTFRDLTREVVALLPGYVPE